MRSQKMATFVMKIKSLETFFWIAKLGSFRATAKKLYASQPTISARISGLEDELGIELFDRDTELIIRP